MVINMTEQRQPAIAVKGKESLKKSAASSRERKQQASAQSPRQYAEAVEQYSKIPASQSLYTGPHFRSLATYLQLPYQIGQTNNQQAFEQGITRKYPFVSLYDLDPKTSERIRHFDTITHFEDAARKLLSNGTHGKLLFMRGYPSPEWLSAIGAQYKVDPWYFLRHLDFRLARPDSFSLPSLPSTGTSMVRLRVNTIGGSRFESLSNEAQKTLDLLRSQNAQSIQNYQERLRSHSEYKLGDSIVRGRSIHDLRHFTIEQDISICIVRTENSWMGIIWLDIGERLKEIVTSHLSPSLQSKSSQIDYLPVIQQKHHIAFKASSRLLSGTVESQAQIIQSAALLHLDYGRDLDDTAAAADSFYALHELFSFAAFSEVQYLNMLESKLTKELDQSALVEQKNPTLSNLLYHQQDLARHICRIQDNITTIESRNQKQWPRLSLEPEKQLKSETAAEQLLKDYRHLLSRAQILFEQCNRGMHVVMNNAMINESREAITQARGVAKLTKLAFLFIPLGFTTSFWGMNFKQFGTGRQNIWWWFLMSFVVFTFSMLSVKYEVSDVLKRLLKQKPAKDARISDDS